MRTLTKYLIVLLLLSAGQSVNAQTYGWVKNPGSVGNDNGNKIAIDDNENSYITSLIGGGTKHDLCTGAVGNVLQKYNTSGVCQWQTGLPGEATDITYYNFNIYVCGIISGSTNSLYVNKYDLNGIQQGTTYYATTTGVGSSAIQAYGISATQYGVFVCGSIYKEAILYQYSDYNGTATTVDLGSNRFGIIVIKLNLSDLSLAWHNEAAGTGDAEALAICNTPTGNGYSYVTGYFKNTAFTGISSLTSAGAEDLFVAKLENTGVNWLWAKSGGSAGSGDKGTDIVVSPVNTGLVFISGMFPSTGTLATYTLTGGWVAKCSTSNNSWVALNTGGTYAYAVSVDGFGEAYCGGNNYINKYSASLAPIWSAPLNSQSTVRSLASSKCFTYFMGGILFTTGVCNLSIGGITLTNFAAGCAANFDVLLGRIGNGLGITTTGINCVSTDFPLTATSGYTTYTWTPSIGTTANVLAQPCTNNIITYSVTATNTTCTQTASITVRPKVTAALSSGNCMGTFPWTFNATIPNGCGVPTTTYKFYRDGSVGGFGTSPSFTTSFGSSFYVVITNGAGCSATSNTSVINCTCCREANETVTNSDSKIFPNPNRGLFKISSLVAGDKLTVINTTGQTVYQYEIKGETPEFEIDLGQVSSGMYLLKIENGKNSVIKKFSVDD